MRVLKFKVDEGVDALCDLLPNLGKHEHSRPMRDQALKIAAGLVAGEIESAIFAFFTENGDQTAIIVANRDVDQAKMMEKLEEVMPQANDSAETIPLPLRTLH